jgi:hypothetical protein
MQQDRNKRRSIPNYTPEQAWEAFEHEFGPLAKVDVERLKQWLLTLLGLDAFHDRPTMRVPVDVAIRVLQEVIDKCPHHKLSAEVRDMRISANKMLRAVRKSRAGPKHRPRKNAFLKLAEGDACHELEQRRRELMYYQGMSSDDALHQAAEEIAPGYMVRPATLISWLGNPGRRRRRRRRRRK